MFKPIQRNRGGRRSIPGDDCFRAGCKVKWGLGNQLFVYAGSKDKPDADEPSGFQGNVNVHEVKWDTEMHSRVARKLVNEAHGIFMNLQQSADLPNKQELMSKHSREYRSVIKACVMDLQAELKHPSPEADRTSQEAQLQLFEVIELIWSLCEILYVDSIPIGALMLKLQHWFRLHFVQSDHLAQEVFKEDPPHASPSFWPAVYSFVFQGRIQEAVKLLSVHPDSDSEAYKLIARLMTSMPLFSISSQASTGEFERSWYHWQEICSEHLRDASFMAHPHLLVICQILCGDDDVFIAHKDLLGTWYCFLIARLFYQNALIKVSDIQEKTQFCIDVYGGLSTMQSWDSILLAVIEFDIHQVIKECSSSLSSWWLAAHLTDLLQHSGRLATQTLHFGSTLREFLLLEYATSLMSHHSLWQIGILYLDHCPEYGRFYIEEFIERLPLETELKAQKVLKICEDRDLQSQIRCVCKTMGMKALHTKRYGAALSWSLRSKDVNFATLVAEKFLDEYNSSGGFVELDLLDQLGSSMLLSSKLTFLGKYREFHRLYEDSDFKAAGSLLLALLSAKIAPPKFSMTLLLDALPLLEADSLIFNSQETYELMHCLEEINIQHKLRLKEKSDEVEMDNEVDAEKLDLMKLGLARNLARAIVHEGMSLDPF